MARHVCTNCGATVVDEEFCPTCGSWIDPLTTGRARNSDDFEEFDLEDRPTSLIGRSGDPIICPSCGATNPPGNRHCEECGARLRQGPLPAAPRPAVQATAGVRAVIALSALLGVVVLGALLINLFSDEGPTSTTADAANTTTTKTTDGVVEPGPINIISATCEPPGLGGSFGCPNLIDESDGEFQINWVGLPDTERSVVIHLTFAQPMVVERIDWSNIADEDRFRRNYRAKGLRIEAEGNAVPVAWELQNVPGPQSLQFAAIRANWIEITVQSAWDAEVVGDATPFEDLAIDEITVIGYPARDTTAPSETTTSGTTDTTAGS
ncbi:MAG: zinc ribbon domain-containing protein [Acidimicrobiia bacterium]|nr:zinc ribbon domain-containing protein [Acidimicrobiia bacterium]